MMTYHYQGERVTMLYYRFHGFPVAADAPLGDTFGRVRECLRKAGVKNPRLRFCLHGPRGCAQIVARFPELRRFLSTAGPQSGAVPVEHLSNFGPSAPGAFAGPEGQVALETIAAVVAGIPREFPIYMATIVLGPVLEGSKFSRPWSRHSPRLEMDLQSVRLSWQSSPTDDGRRYFLSFNEALPSGDRRQSAPAWMKTLYAAFPGASAEKIRSDADRITRDYQGVVSRSGKFVRSKSIGDDLKLPHELPDSQAASHLNYTPIRRVRSKIARAFAQDGWKDASVPGYGMYELRKRSRFRRRLCLLFWVEKCGPSLRTISAMMRLGPERSRLTVWVPAERSMRYEIRGSESGSAEPGAR